MMNHGQEKINFKPVIAYGLQEEVPPLVTYRDNTYIKSGYNRNQLLQQARNNQVIQNQPNQSLNATPTFKPNKSPPLPVKNIQLNQQNKSHFDSGLQQSHSAVNEYSYIEKRQNEELRQTIKQLKNQLDQLKEVNEGLTIRLKEVESSYRNLRSSLQKTNQEEKRKLQASIYRDIELYIKVVIQDLTLSLKNEKMTPILQGKLQSFMAQLMQINAITVERVKNRPRKQILLLEASRNIKNSRLEKASQNYRTDFSLSKNEINLKQKYASIMQRLSGDNLMSKSFAGVGAYSMPKQYSQIRHGYVTTPQKRRKIFE